MQRALPAQLKPAITYDYRVYAFNGAGSSAPSDDAFAETEAGSVIELTASSYKVKGVRKVDLLWSGAEGDDVEIYRNGSWLETTANDGSRTDTIGKKGESSYIYQVCETERSNCSNAVVVGF